MIDWLKRTYEHLPKQSGETERTLGVTDLSDQYELRLVVWFGEQRFMSSTRITVFEYTQANWHVEQELIETVCRKADEHINGIN